jgi:hypothetical protein
LAKKWRPSGGRKLAADIQFNQIDTVEMALLSPSGVFGDGRLGPSRGSGKTRNDENEANKNISSNGRQRAVRFLFVFFYINRVKMAEIFNYMQMLMGFEGKAQFRCATSIWIFDRTTHYFTRQAAHA